MTKRLIGAAVILAALSACNTPESIARDHDVYCRKFGFVPGTDGYANCRMTVENHRQSRLGTAFGTPAVIPQPQQQRTTCLRLAHNQIDCVTQ
jgi:hypothetical protein